jgi:hypothetical protein
MNQREPITPIDQEQQRQIARLLWRLGSRDSADRWTAQTELRKNSAIPVPLLLAFMVRFARVRRQSPFLLFLGLLTATLLLLGLLLVFDGLYGRASHLPVLMAGMIGLALMLRRWLVMRDAATRALANYNDPRAAGPLIEHLAGDQGDRETRIIARELLLHLLPRVQPQIAGQLTVPQQDALRALAAGDDTDLKAAAGPCLQVIAARRTHERLRGNLLRVIDASDFKRAQPTESHDHNGRSQDILTQDIPLQNTSTQGDDT